MENRTVSRWINQSGKKSKTVSLWINQFEDVPCQRVRERDKPAKQEIRSRTVSTFIEKRDKPTLEKFCYTSNGEIFCLTIMYLLMKFRKVQTIFSRESRKISLQSKRISRRRSGSCFIERREIIQQKREFYESHQIVLL